MGGIVRVVTTVVALGLGALASAQVVNPDEKPAGGAAVATQPPAPAGAAASGTIVAAEIGITQTDWTALVNDLCQVPSDKVTQLCPRFQPKQRDRFAGYRGLPVSLVAPEHDALCKEIERKDSPLASAGEASTRLKEACGHAKTRSAIGAAFASAGLNAARGFSDFLKKRAKDELTLYAAQRLGQTLCSDAAWPKGDEATGCAAGQCPEKRQKLGPALFANGCAALFPHRDPAKPKDLGDVDVEAITSGSAEVAVRKDLTSAPKTLIRQIPLCLDGPAQCTVWQSVADETVEGIVSVATGTTAPIALFKEVAENLDVAGDHTVLACDLTTGRVTPPCVLGLLIEIGREGAAQYEANPKPDAGVWLDKSIRSYCARYSTQKDLACLVKPADPGSYLKNWHAHLERFQRTVKQLAELQAAINAARKSGAMPGEIAKRALPDIARTLDGGLDLWLEVLKEKDGGDADKLARLARARKILGIAIAVFNDDAVALRDAMLALIAEVKLSDKLRRPLLFAAALASADDREEAKSVIEEAAAPLGSYRSKYRSSNPTHWAVNAYVGPFLTFGQKHRNVLGDPEVEEPSSKLTGLSSLVGIDWTATRSEKAHLGFGVTVIDPLAFTASEAEGEGLKRNVGALFTPGAYFRVGLLGSPFTLVGSYVLQPGLQSEQVCGTAPCWKGSRRFGASLAIDIPVFVVK
jgi:hypothetical protein